MSTTREVLKQIENVLNAHRLSPAPSFDADDLEPKSIADGSYSISPGAATTTLFRGCQQIERAFRISVLWLSRPHGDLWDVPALIDKEEALTLALLELSFADQVESDYAPDEGKKFVQLNLSLTTRYEREGV